MSDQTSHPLNPEMKKLLQPILDHAGAVDVEVVTKLRAKNTLLRAQKEYNKQEHTVQSEQAAEQLRNAQDAQSDLTRERDEARDEVDRLRSQLRAFGVEDASKTKEEIGALIAQTEIDFTELKMEVDLWINVDVDEVTFDQKSIVMNAAMHLAGMFQAMRLAADLFQDGELAVSETKVNEADQFAGVVRATLMGLRLGWRYREALKRIVESVLNGDVIEGVEDVADVLPLLGMVEDTEDGYEGDEDDEGDEGDEED